MFVMSNKQYEGTRKKQVYLLVDMKYEKNWNLRLF